MHESGEMYLETILVLGKKKPTVRAVDVADDLGYSKPSVSRGLARLKADGCIIVDADGRIALTEKSLDGETERLLLERLSGQVGNKTLILVTHRETIARLCAFTVRIRKSNSSV